MTLLIIAGIYVFIGLATTLAVVDGENWKEVVASIIVGVVWPLFFAVRLISKYIR